MTRLLLVAAFGVLGWQIIYSPIALSLISQEVPPLEGFEGMVAFGTFTLLVYLISYRKVTETKIKEVTVINNEFASLVAKHVVNSIPQPKSPVPVDTKALAQMVGREVFEILNDHDNLENATKIGAALAQISGLDFHKVNSSLTQIGESLDTINSLSNDYDLEEMEEKIDQIKDLKTDLDKLLNQ